MVLAYVERGIIFIANERWLQPDENFKVAVRATPLLAEAYASRDVLQIIRRAPAVAK